MERKYNPSTTCEFFFRRFKKMNLKLGEIKVNGFLLKSDTTIEEMLGNSKFRSYISDSRPFAIFSAEYVIIDGCTFNIRIYFSNNRIDEIRLTPVNLEMKDPGYPDEQYQNEKKKVCDAFLRKHIGEPLEKTKTVLCYEYNWGSVCSIIFLSGRNEYTGGFVEIIYIK